jgi:hypothetical protein
MNGTPTEEVEKRIGKPETISTLADFQVWTYRVEPGEPPGFFQAIFRDDSGGGNDVGRVFLRNGVIDHLVLERQKAGDAAPSN